MTPERFGQIERVCQAALDLPVGERPAFLDEACRGDGELRAEVEGLLAGASRASSVFEVRSALVPPPALAPGQRLGPYEVQCAIGAGGMGEVYQARDTRLGRTVAVKVLPPGLSTDPDRRARFAREATAIAGLNHPHICTLHDVGEHEGSIFLVMEHLAGETLAERLEKGALGLEQALSIATEIAAALSAAHRQGVIHRDLKPGNVMLTKSGTKLLDFGLAKLIGHGEQPAASMVTAAPTQAATLTGEGVIVGTLQYMAPEQLQGKPPDARTDLWALGVILYEMVTGKRAFEGTSVVSVMGAILEREPVPITALQPLTPPALLRFVGRCLAKDAEVRWQTAVDVADELRWLTAGSGARGAVATGGEHGLSLGVAVGLGGVLLAAALGVAFLLGPASGRAPSAPRSLRLDIVLPDDKPLAPAGLVSPGHDKLALALSPDGTRLAYVALISGKTQLCLRDSSGQVAPLEGTFGSHTPFFSPDGEWIGFFAENKLKKIPSKGGKVTELAEAPNAWGASWGSDGFIYFNRHEGEGVFRVSDEGDALDRVCDGGMPEFVASGKGLLVNSGERVVRGQRLESGIDYVSLKGDVPVREVATGNRARYLPGGHLVFSVGSTVMATRFDPEEGAAEGEGVTLCDGVRSANYSVAQFAVSESGTFVYVPGRPQGLTSFAWVDRTGRKEVSGLPAAEAHYSNYSLSPDGTRLAYSLDGEIFVWDGARRSTTRLTPRAPSGARMASVRPRWTRDGKTVFYQATSPGTSTRLMAAPVDGSPPAQVWVIDSPMAYPMGFSPDGGTLSLFTVGGKSSYDLWLMRIGSSGRLFTGSEPQLFLGTPFADACGLISADGRWMLFMSDRSGQNEIWATTYPKAGPMFQLSDNGGREAMWNPAVPMEVVYVNGTAMYAVDVSRGPANPGKPRLLFDGPYPDTAGFGYDMGPDGRFLMLQNPDILKPATTLAVITNVFEELKAKVPPAR